MATTIKKKKTDNDKESIFIETKGKKKSLNFTKLKNRVKDEINQIEANKTKLQKKLGSMKHELIHKQDPPVSQLEKDLCANRLPLSFYDQPCEELAKILLGKILVRRLDNGTILKGLIVETESYFGLIDKASMTYAGKVTPRNLPMYMEPGTIFVYMTYGMYHCFNISSQGEGSAVLIRAVEPISGIEEMKKLRISNSKSKKSVNLNEHELCNGPSKLCIAYDINREHNKYSLCTWKGMWIENNSIHIENKIISCSRIGIDSSGPEWSQKPLRFYINGNKSVSKRNKIAEKLVL